MTRRFWDIRLQKCGHLEIRVRDQSRSSKPTRISIRRVLLTFHSNRGSISYRFRDERRFLPLMKLCYIVLCTLTNVTNRETVQDHGNDADWLSLNMRCSKSLCSYRVLLNLWSHVVVCVFTSVFDVTIALNHWCTSRVTVVMYCENMRCTPHYS